MRWLYSLYKSSTPHDLPDTAAKLLWWLQSQKCGFGLLFKGSLSKSDNLYDKYCIPHVENGSGYFSTSAGHMNIMAIAAQVESYFQ